MSKTARGGGSLLGTRRRIIAPLAVALIAAAVALLARCASPASPIVLVQTPGPIIAFATDGETLAWVACRSRSWTAPSNRAGVYVQARRAARAVKVGSFGCSQYPEFDATIAVGGGRVAWMNRGDSSPLTEREDLFVGGSDTRARLLGRYWLNIQGGLIVVVAGSRRGVFSSVTHYEITLLSMDKCLGLEFKYEACRYNFANPSLKRIDAAGVASLPPVPAVVVLGAGGPYVVVASARAGGTLDATGPVEVRDGGNGRLISALPPLGTVLEVAADTRTVVAVVAKRGGGRAIIWASPTAGAVLGRLPVRSEFSTQDLAVAGDQILYLAGDKIRAFDMRRLRLRTLARVKGDFFGLAAARGGLVWAETDNRGSRIRWVALPS